MIVIMLIVFFFYRADYHGVIRGLEGNQFTLYPLKVNPEYEHYTPVIFFSKDTYVIGETNSITDLKPGQEVELWVEEIDEKKIAKKIKVINE